MATGNLNAQTTTTAAQSAPRPPVFISYCQPDKTVAEAVCAGLENSGIPCWIAPRNVCPGENWGRSIIKSIAASKVMVVVFSSHTNESPHVMNEIERAVSHRMVILPFRIEKVQPCEDLELFISSRHWLDAYDPPLEPKIAELVAAVRTSLGATVGTATTPATATTTMSSASAGSQPEPEPGELCYHHFVVMRNPDGSPWELGRGAMGVTYKAEDSRLKRPVALKVVGPERLTTEAAREKFLQEARATAALQHPNIASIYYFGEQGGSCFYAMELVAGKTLESMVREDGPLPAAQALAVASQAAAALACAHESGLVHRDVKPSNIMVATKPGSETSVRMIDFGLAAANAGGGGPGTKHFEGTPLYASPEQLDRAAPDARSDVYSLGASLYFALAGKPPYEGGADDIASRQIMGPFPAEGLAAANTPAPVVALVGRLMDKDPGKRPQNSGDARSEIEGLLRNFAPSGAESEQMGKTAMEWMAARFTSISRLGSIDGGTLYKVVADDGRECSAIAFDTSAHGLALADVAADISPRIQSLKAEAVRRITETAKVKDGYVITAEGMEGTRLLSVMRVRKSLPPAEAAAILKPLAEAMDEAAAAGLAIPQLSLRDILLKPEEKPETPLEETQWPGLRPVINFLPVGEIKEADANTTIVGQNMGFSANLTSEATSPAVGMASLAYEILGGMSAPGTGHYIPLAELSQEANSALKSALENPQGTGAADLMEKILPEAERAASARTAAGGTQKTRKPPGKSHKEEIEEPRKRIGAAAGSKRTWIISSATGAAAVLVAALAIWAFSGAGKPGESKKSGTAGPTTATPGPTPAPAGTTTVATAETTKTPEATPTPKPKGTKNPEVEILLAKAAGFEDTQDFVSCLETYNRALDLLPKSEKSEQAEEIRKRVDNAVARAQEPFETNENIERVAPDPRLMENLRELVSKTDLPSACRLLGILTKKSDPQGSLKLMEKAANQGDRLAMALTGSMIAAGNRNPGPRTEAAKAADFSEGATWLKKAADLMEPKGMLYYGECLLEGNGVPANEAEGIRLISNASDLGDLEASSKLGEIYHKGVLVPQDLQKAYRLMEEASRGGILDAQANLGVMIIKGEVVRQDKPKAMRLWKEGAEKGNPICAFFYAMGLEGGETGPADPKGAREWYRKAAEWGNAAAENWCRENGVSYASPNKR